MVLIGRRGQRNAAARAPELAAAAVASPGEPRDTHRWFLARALPWADVERLVRAAGAAVFDGSGRSVGDDGDGRSGRGSSSDRGGGSGCRGGARHPRARVEGSASVAATVLLPSCARGLIEQDTGRTWSPVADLAGWAAASWVEPRLLAVCRLARAHRSGPLADDQAGLSSPT
ncbi:DUF6401 family natural product biosynthesis protein [Amycolatopsis sp. NPDC023774]|uniref:DUF6401 family natural product biosynthesis protein n=1 Tax=Amycolatopsis sp. NPDC023774 TaxID=3155015 RepID=UPI00340CE739